jgi:hypothetical protein
VQEWDLKTANIKVSREGKTQIYNWYWLHQVPELTTCTPQFPIDECSEKAFEHYVAMVNICAQGRRDLLTTNCIYKECKKCPTRLIKAGDEFLFSTKLLLLDKVATQLDGNGDYIQGAKEYEQRSGGGIHE